ncbi:MAG: RlmE family RNA methyltransferase [Candidatus Lokiarchaeota archaeon]|nr:RlmE family RNA methyltransferase [Candidatus Lokiarchaeota archaeon]
MPTNWIKKRKKDEFYKKAKSEKLSSRAAFKLLEMKNFGIFSKDIKVAIDICAHPGSWIEVLLREIPNIELIIGIDIQNIKLNSPKVIFIKGDISNEELKTKIDEILGNKFADLVVSDCSPKLSGDKYLDHNRQLYLAEKSLELALIYLKSKGNAVFKFFQGINENEFITKVKKEFIKIKRFKPKSSLKSSSEMYLIGFQKR